MNERYELTEEETSEVFRLVVRELLVVIYGCSDEGWADLEQTKSSILASLVKKYELPETCKLTIGREEDCDYFINTKTWTIEKYHG